MWTNRLDRGHKEAEELDLVRIPIDDHQHASARFTTRAISLMPRHVGEQHHAELRSGHVETSSSSSSA